MLDLTLCAVSQITVYIYISPLRFTVSVPPFFGLFCVLPEACISSKMLFFRLPFVVFVVRGYQSRPTTLGVVFEHTHEHVHRHTSTRKHATASLCCHPCDNPRSLEVACHASMLSCAFVCLCSVCDRTCATFRLVSRSR